MRATILTALCLAGFAHTALAQSTERLRISINGAGQVSSRSLKQDFTVPINVEPAPISANIDLKAAPAFDVGGSYRLLNRLAAGVSFSSISTTVGGTLDAKLPHPFYFNQPRAISGALSDLAHKEMAVHIYGMYFIPLGGKLDLGVFGGPSRFNVKQDFVTDVDYSATYPFDTATFVGAPAEQITVSALGYNAGIDVTYRLSPMFGVGGLIRFSSASKTVTVSDGNDVDAKFGGLQAGGGVRIIF